ncbi:MBL fold metallo-hydrolase [Arachidicoccus sp.]|uniref:MBL fold metallo-hydrolase n=1 Tax=Arachidicoccus sp. TaxID=1872624 RepID=UPI003D1FE183
MHIEQLYTGCLSEAAYYVESNGEAAIIDPMRDIESYLALAEKRGAKIKYVFETHFHADFVSGHLDLSKATGAPIIYGPQTKANFAFKMAKDGECFPLGDCSIEVIHTPGHTLESSCYLLKDKSGKGYAVFTGDTLFVGDVGRPDLAQKGELLSSEDLAGMLYESLQEKILPLADDILVYPAHGAGSSCGKNIGASTQSTIAEQKQTNYALQSQSKEDFIKVVLEGLAEPPQYFPINAAINKNGYDKLDEILQRALQPLSTKEVEDKSHQDNVWVIDTRNKETFVQGFIPGSIFIGLDGRFAEWAGSLISFDKKLILVTEPGMEQEAMVRLARVGFDKMIGFLEGGFEAWKDAGLKTDMIIDVEVDELAMDIPFDEHLLVIDVRKEIEFADGHVKDAVNIPLSSLTDPASMSPIEDTDNIYLHCQSGYRSVIAASMMKKQGIHNLRNIVGGWKAIAQEKKIKTAKSPAILN